LEISLSATVDSSAMTALIQQHVSAVVSSLEVEVYLHSDLTGHVSVGPFPFQMLIGNFVVLPVPRQDV
jgi:hypothetical protein